MSDFKFDPADIKLTAVTGDTTEITIIDIPSEYKTIILYADGTKEVLEVNWLGKLHYWFRTKIIGD